MRKNTRSILIWISLIATMAIFVLALFSISGCKYSPTPVNGVTVVLPGGEQENFSGNCTVDVFYHAATTFSTPKRRYVVITCEREEGAYTTEARYFLDNVIQVTIHGGPVK